ncbi:MAG: alpha-N-arabinofuranosidase [Mucilaginibacter sp.]|nr:alpha-N-arabinofuranosidase [Mucilaginibacter sp.]
MKRKTFYFAAILLCFLVTFRLSAQNAKLTLNLNKSGAKVSPTLYGLMTEEINHSYDGGLYAELIRNRVFKDNMETPEAWSVVQEGGGKGTIMLMGANELNVPMEQQRNAINDALTVCLRLVVEKGDGRVGIANEGYWGIPVKPQTTYQASFYAKGTDEAAGPLNVSIESNDGTVTYASGQVTLDKGPWKKYRVSLTTTAGIKPTAAGRFVISTKRPGSYYFNLVSLFPPTYHNRPNGNRIDLMQMMADMKPTFLRFPGGNFLEGDYFSTRFPWKSTLGPLEQRPGHPGCWGYRASDGIGLLEFLEWCEDLKIEPLLAVYAGYSLKGDYVYPGPLLKPYIEDALNEIEYVTGSVKTKWGAKRAEDGHPAPFKLSYVEIGNEDWFDRSPSYDGRFNQFRNAIKARYPQILCISTISEEQKGKVTTGDVPSMIDEHYYRSAWQMEEDADHYDKYNRATSPKIFVGEWATREGVPTTNMNAALGDAAWMTGMERNADLVLKSCYAPLFVNVNPKTGTLPRAWQWGSDLIGYNAITSYGSPSYYVQKMFNTYLGSQVIPVAGTNIPVKRATKQDSTNRRAIPKKATIPTLFYVATKNTKGGAVYLKVVNTSDKAQAVTITLNGATGVAAEGTMVTLKGDKPDDTNTIDEPEKIIPVTSKIKDISKTFTQNFAPYSVNVIQMYTRP